MEIKRLGPKSRIDSFRYALRGIKALFAGEPNMWIHLTAAAVVVVGGIWLGFEAIEWIAALFAIALVMVAEAFNSAIEKLADYACRGQRHELVGRSKDMAAAGVLIASIIAAIIGGLLFVPHLLHIAGWQLTV